MNILGDISPENSNQSLWCYLFICFISSPLTSLYKIPPLGSGSIEFFQFPSLLSDLLSSFLTLPHVSAHIRPYYVLQSPKRLLIVQYYFGLCFYPFAVFNGLSNSVIVKTLVSKRLIYCWYFSPEDYCQ